MTLASKVTLNCYDHYLWGSRRTLGSISAQGRISAWLGYTCVWHHWQPLPAKLALHSDLRNWEGHSSSQRKKHLNVIGFFHFKHKELCLGVLSISNVSFSYSALYQGSAYIWMHCPFHFLFPTSCNLTSPAILFSSGGRLYSVNCWLLQYRYRYRPLNYFNTYSNVLFLNLSLHLRSFVRRVEVTQLRLGVGLPTW